MHHACIKKNGTVSFETIRESGVKKACSFERIYFSRGSDAEIYQERKELGRLIFPSILKAIDNDKIVINLNINRGAPSYNMGILVDTIEVKNNQAIYETKEKSDGPCKLIFTFYTIHHWKIHSKVTFVIKNVGYWKN